MSKNGNSNFGIIVTVLIIIGAIYFSAKVTFNKSNSAQPESESEKVELPQEEPARYFDESRLAKPYEEEVEQVEVQQEESEPLWIIPYGLFKNIGGASCDSSTAILVIEKQVGYGFKFKFTVDSKGEKKVVSGNASIHSPYYSNYDNGDCLIIFSFRPNGSVQIEQCRNNTGPDFCYDGVFER